MSSSIKKIEKYMKRMEREEKMERALNRLGKIDMTVELLRATGVGKAVNQLCRHEVHGKAAFQIVEQWKEIVRKSGVGQASSSSSVDEGSQEMERVNTNLPNGKLHGREDCTNKTNSGESTNEDNPKDADAKTQQDSCSTDKPQDESSEKAGFHDETRCAALNRILYEVLSRRPMTPETSTPSVLPSSMCNVRVLTDYSTLESAPTEGSNCGIRVDYRIPKKKTPPVSPFSGAHQKKKNSSEISRDRSKSPPHSPPGKTRELMTPGVPCSSTSSTSFNSVTSNITSPSCEKKQSENFSVFNVSKSSTSARPHQPHSPRKSPILEKDDDTSTSNVSSCWLPIEDDNGDKPDFFDKELMFKPKIQRQKIYSGRRRTEESTVPTLRSSCLRVACRNIDSVIDSLGSVPIPFEILRPMLEKCSPEQLERAESRMESIKEHTGVLWKRNVKKAFPCEQVKSGETFQNAYFRLKLEGDERLRALNEKIKQSMHNRRREVVIAELKPKIRRLQNDVRKHTSPTKPNGLGISGAKKPVEKKKTGELMLKTMKMCNRKRR